MAMGVTLLVSSCGTYAGTGAYVGAGLGSILGSAIGGLSDGPRGADLGTIVGMAGGAVVGGAIGNAQDQKRQADLDQYRHDKTERAAARAARQQQGAVEPYAAPESDPVYGSGFDESNSGDDRIYDFSGSDYTGDYTAQRPVATAPASSSVEELKTGFTYSPDIEVRNARFVDDNEDNAISRGELCKVIFEIVNRSSRTLYDVQPVVVEAGGNRHLLISPSVHVEKIEPGKGIRYTALVKADNRLKKGNAKICVSVLEGTNKIISKVSEFNIPTLGK